MIDVLYDGLLEMIWNRAGLLRLVRSLQLDGSYRFEVFSLLTYDVDDSALILGPHFDQDWSDGRS